ncbi:MAG: hypothetical protein IPG59_01795 [Candidatus Melainabacteria bacterium]|nr:MAG: hypothetical protein IPG59_01795 [Candidatus Melainabacteria bacterium]
MIYDFDEEVLAAARASKSGKIAQEWNQEEIEKFIKSRQIYSIDMLPDQSLYVTFALVPSGGKYNHITVYDDFIVHPHCLNEFRTHLKPLPQIKSNPQLPERGKDEATNDNQFSQRAA